MQKSFSGFRKVMVAACIAASVAFGATEITDKITDPNAKALLYQALGKVPGSPIYDSDVDTMTVVDVSEAGIKSLAGIEYFTSLTKLYCSDNELTALNVSKNTALWVLDCSGNQLTALDVTKNTALFYFLCFYNKLTALDVSKNTELFQFGCGNNELTALDVSKNTALRLLSCGSNKLTALDVSKNIALERLYCYDNKLTALDVSQNIVLADLNCSNNLLTTLNLSNNTGLRYLDVSGNYFTGKDKIIGLSALNFEDERDFVFGEQKDPATLNTPIKNAAAKQTFNISFAGIRNGEINLNLKAGNYTAELYNVQGRLLSSVNISATNGMNTTGLKTNNLSKGIFILNVKQAGASVLKQKIKI